MPALPSIKASFKKYFEIDGKRYQFFTGWKRKSLAEKSAENVRKKGYNARVIPYMNLEHGPFAVYIRKAE